MAQRSEMPAPRRAGVSNVIGFNHLFIDKGALTGPGYYAVQLLENFARLPEIRDQRYRLRAYVRQGTRHHYSEEIQSYLVDVSFPGGRFARVLHEQIFLPWRARHDGLGILFSPGFVTPLFGAPLLIATIHDMYYRVMPEAVEAFQRMYWRLMIPATSHVCDIVLAVSRNSARDIERFLPSARGKVVVTPLASRFDPAEIADAAADVPAARPYVLMIASLTANKNVRTVLKALAILRDRGTFVDLVHIGADLRGELAAAQAELGLSEQVRSLGKVSDPVLVATAKSSLAVVVASLYEGFGLPAIEAHALGAPLICSSAGALPEVVGDAALMFEPTDAQALAGRIEEVIRNPELREALRVRGRTNAGRFSWRRTAQLTLGVFEQTLERRFGQGALS